MRRQRDREYLQIHAAQTGRTDRQYDPDSDLRSALYSKPVAEVCLNCSRKRCATRSDKGCPDYETVYHSMVEALGNDKYRRDRKCSESGS